MSDRDYIMMRFREAASAQRIADELNDSSFNGTAERTNWTRDEVFGVMNRASTSGDWRCRLRAIWKRDTMAGRMYG